MKLRHESATGTALFPDLFPKSFSNSDLGSWLTINSQQTWHPQSFYSLGEDGQTQPPTKSSSSLSTATGSQTRKPAGTLHHPMLPKWRSQDPTVILDGSFHTGLAPTSFSMGYPVRKSVWGGISLEEFWFLPLCRQLLCILLCSLLIWLKNMVRCSPSLWKKHVNEQEDHKPQLPSANPTEAV